MRKNSLKYISLFLLFVLIFHSFMPLILSPYFKVKAEASSDIDTKEVFRGFGLAVLLYVLSRIGQALFSSEGLSEDSDEDVELLARVIYAEARGEPHAGQIAVGAVVLNRLDSSNFPDNVKDVIFAKRQFSSVVDGQIHYTPDRKAFDAAEKALSGEDPTSGALYFYNPDKSEPDNLRWLEENTIFIKKIGNHIFSR